MTGKTTDLAGRLIRILQKAEDSVLVGLLLLMMVIAVLQIVLRNLFDSGILFGDALIRVLVLWISLVGAMVASRNNRHISIDAISRYLPGSVKKPAARIVCIFTAFICALMSYFSLKFVLMEKADGLIAFSGIPAWVCESIIPVSFAIISFRYLLLTFTTWNEPFKPTMQ